MPEEKFLNIQIAFFFRDKISRPENVREGLERALEGVFDQTPIVIPIPERDDFLETPIVQMTSSNGEYKCDISRKRLDFYRFGKGRDYTDVSVEFKENARRLFGFFRQQTPINRIGFVPRFFLEEQNAQDIIQKIIKDEFKRLHPGAIQEATVRYATRTEIANLRINDLTVIEKKKVQLSEENNLRLATGVKITRDFNTLPDDEYKSGLQLEQNDLDQIVEHGEANLKLNEIKSILWSGE